MQRLKGNAHLVQQHVHIEVTHPDRLFAATLQLDVAQAPCRLDLRTGPQIDVPTRVCSRHRRLAMKATLG